MCLSYVLSHLFMPEVSLGVPFLAVVVRKIQLPPRETKGYPQIRYAHCLMVCCSSLTTTLLLRPYSSMLLEKPETEGVQDTAKTHIIFKDVTETVVKRRTQGGRSLRSGVLQTIRSNVDQTQLIQSFLRLQERFCSGTSTSSSKRVNSPHKQITEIVNNLKFLYNTKQRNANFLN